MKNNAKKYSIVGIIILVLFLAGFSLLSSSNNSGNNSTQGVVPLISSDSSEDKNPVADTSKDTDLEEVIDDSKPEDFTFESANDCLPGQVFDEKDGCTPKEVAPTGEITGYEEVEGSKEYISSNHPILLEGKSSFSSGTNGYISQGSIDKHDLYIKKIDSLKKGEYLTFSIVYKDNDGNEKTWVNFKSDSVKKTYLGKNLIGQLKEVVFYSYSGCLTSPDGEYEYCTIEKDCSYAPVDSSSYKNCKNIPGGITVAEPYGEKPYLQEFALKGTSFEKIKAPEGFSLHLSPKFLLTIK